MQGATVTPAHRKRSDDGIIFNEESTLIKRRRIAQARSVVLKRLTLEFANSIQPAAGSRFTGQAGSTQGYRMYLLPPPAVGKPPKYLIQRAARRPRLLRNSKLRQLAKGT